MNLDSNELFKRALKYAIHLLTLYLALSTMPKGCLSSTELILISLMGASVYALLDMFMPAIAPVIKVN